MEKKKIVFITGTRADYGKLKSLMKAVDSSNKLECYIYVSGMHLLERYGGTYKEVLADKYKNTYIEYGLNPSENMSENLGETILCFSKYIRSFQEAPDLIVVHGDRTDALAGAIAGALCNIRVAHIEGGEITGTIDESMRHAISKFAHVHFTCNSEASKRLIQLGENKECIFTIGSPDIDIMMSDELPTLDAVKERYAITFPEYAILMLHPVTTEIDDIDRITGEVIEAIKKSEKSYVLIYPNNDTGSKIILDRYAELENDVRFRVFPSIRFEYFLTLLKNANFIIGNSSSGIREAGIYGIPAIDIGTRQTGRHDGNTLKNIQYVEAEQDKILNAINATDRYRHYSNAFGKGNSTELFMKCLMGKNIWRVNVQKKFYAIT